MIWKSPARWQYFEWFSFDEAGALWLRCERRLDSTSVDDQIFQGMIYMHEYLDCDGLRTRAPRFSLLSSESHCGYPRTTWLLLTAISWRGVRSDGQKQGCDDGSPSFWCQIWLLDCKRRRFYSRVWSRGIHGDDPLSKQYFHFFEIHSWRWAFKLIRLYLMLCITG